MLTRAEIDRFHEEGFLVLRGVVGAPALAAMRADLDQWIEESRAHAGNYGEMARGKRRFDLEAGHSAAQPKLRRVANPVDVSDAYRAVLWDGPVVDAVADIIGPDVKFHHCKLNLKLPGMETYVGWHQDHPFDPHTNDDVVVALLMLDDMTVENGCLQVVPGSHLERYSHYDGDRFVGEIAGENLEQFDRRSVHLTGAAGDLILSDTWMVHGSAANRTQKPRRMLICDYSAADAFTLTPMAVPTVNAGRILRGSATRFARFREGVVELPPPYEEDSFFTVQGQKEAIFA